MAKKEKNKQLPDVRTSGFAVEGGSWITRSLLTSALFLILMGVSVGINPNFTGFGELFNPNGYFGSLTDPYTIASIIGNAAGWGTAVAGGVGASVRAIRQNLYSKRAQRVYGVAVDDQLESDMTADIDKFEFATNKEFNATFNLIHEIFVGDIDAVTLNNDNSIISKLIRGTTRSRFMGLYNKELAINSADRLKPVIKILVDRLATISPAYIALTKGNISPEELAKVTKLTQNSNGARNLIAEAEMIMDALHRIMHYTKQDQMHYSKKGKAGYNYHYVYRYMVDEVVKHPGIVLTAPTFEYSTGREMLDENGNVMKDDEGRTLYSGYTGAQMLYKGGFNVRNLTATGDKMDVRRALDILYSLDLANGFDMTNFEGSISIQDIYDARRRAEEAAAQAEKAAQQAVAYRDEAGTHAGTAKGYSDDAGKSASTAGQHASKAHQLVGEIETLRQEADGHLVEIRKILPYIDDINKAKANIDTINKYVEDGNIDKLTTLQTELETLHSKLKDIVDAYEKGEDKNGQAIKDIIREYRARLKSTETLLNKVRTGLTNVNNRLNKEQAKRKRGDQLNATITSIQAEITDFEQRFKRNDEDTKTAMSSIQAEIDKITDQATKDDLTKRLQEASKRVEDYRQKGKAYADAIAQIKIDLNTDIQTILNKYFKGKSLEEVYASLGQIVKNFPKLETKVKALVRGLETANKRAHNTNRRLNAEEQRRAELATKTSLQTRIDNYEQEYKENDLSVEDEYNKILAEIRKLTNQSYISELNNNAIAARNRVVKYRTNKKAMLDRIAELERVVQQGQEAFKNYFKKKDFDAVMAELAGFMTAFPGYKSKIKTLEKDLKTTNTTIQNQGKLIRNTISISKYKERIDDIAVDLATNNEDIDKAFEELVDEINQQPKNTKKAVLAHLETAKKNISNFRSIAKKVSDLETSDSDLLEVIKKLFGVNDYKEALAKLDEIGTNFPTLAKRVKKLSDRLTTEEQTRAQQIKDERQKRLQGDKNLQAQINKLKKQKDDFIKKLLGDKDPEAFKQEYEDLLKAFNNLEENSVIKEIKKELEEIWKRIVRFRKNKNTLSARIKTLEDDYDDAKRAFNGKTAKQIREELDAMQTAIEQLQKDAASFASIDEQGKLSGVVADLWNRYQSLSSKVGQNTKRISVLEGQVKVLAAKLQTATTSLNNTATRLNDLSTALSDSTRRVNTRIDEVFKNIKTLKGDIAEQFKQINLTIKRVKDGLVEDITTGLDTADQKANEHYAVIASQISWAFKAAYTALQAYNDVLDQINELEIEDDRLQEQITQWGNDVMIQGEQIGALTRALEDLKKNHANLAANITIDINKIKAAIASINAKATTIAQKKPVAKKAPLPTNIEAGITRSHHYMATIVKCINTRQNVLVACPDTATGEDADNFLTANVKLWNGTTSRYSMRSTAGKYTQTILKKYLTDTEYDEAFEIFRVICNVKGTDQSKLTDAQLNRFIELLEKACAGYNANPINLLGSTAGTGTGVNP